MSAEDTLRASAPLRDRLLSLIGDPIIPPQWRGRAIGLHGELSVPDAPADVAARARDLADAAGLFHRLWALHCRVEGAVFGARNMPEDIGWRADAIELLDQWDRGGAR
ncbi:MAG: hypothetical protein H6701_16605 [Myxococcales bacterium]|nr:hypothetical protein [Myxococcales bacterium]